MKHQSGVVAFAAFAAALVVPAAVVAAENAGDVRILSSTGQAIQFEFTPKHFPARPVQLHGKEFVEYTFENALPLAQMRDAGVPDLRYRSVPLAFQSAENNTLHVLVAEYEEIANVALKPMPELEVRDEMIVVKDYPVDAQRYSVNQFLPGPVAELSSIEQSRSMLIGGVKLFPVHYNPATKTLRRYSRIVVEVVYAGSSALRVQNDDDELFSPILLNAAAAKTWKFGTPRPLNRVAGPPSVLAVGPWYRLTVNDEGMYMLDANWFAAAGISMSGVDPRTIQIYGNGGEQLSESLEMPRPVDLVENAIHVEGEADGQFNPGDHVIFYGRGVQGIRYDPVAKTLRHYIHHYSRSNYYWLTFGKANGKRMTAQPSLADPPGLVPTKFMDAVWVEPDTVNLLRSGKSWLSFPISQGGSQVRTFPLTGVIAAEPRTYRFTLVGGSTAGSTFNVTETGASVGSFFIFGVGGNTVAAERTFEVTGAFPMQNSTSQLRFNFSSSSAGATGWLDWVEIIYPRTFEPSNNYLRFRSPDTTAVVEYQLGAFSSMPAIFNVTDYANVRRITPASGSFRAAETAGGVSEYVAIAPGAYKVPVGVTQIQPQNLRGNVTQYDFIIITTPEFASAANRLKAHRENPAYGNLRTIVVEMNQIYNEFSCGVPDVTAMRDFLKYAYDNWPQNAPKFVCFFGQASYDYKGILGSRSNYVPTWQRTEQPYDDVESGSSDDFFVRYTTAGRLPFMVSGRLNARSTAQAEQLVNRIIRYDTESARDAWKMRALFVGDDGYVGRGVDEEGSIHTRGADIVAGLTPNIFDKKKVYLEEYPAVTTGQSRSKPGAYRDIIDNINRGVLIVNFTGHGNPTVWTHEGVFSVQTSIPQLVNANKLAFFYAATCNFSQFDDPGRETGSEMLMNRPEGGAIGVVSASRKVYSGPNETLNNGIYINMFRQDQFGRVLVDRVATGLFLFKAGGGSGWFTNDEKYLILGDPSMRLQYPREYVAIDTINSASVEFENGLPRSSLIQLKSLSSVTVKGTIRNQANAIDSTAGGRVTLVVNDATRSITIRPYNWAYSISGSLIYRGESTVSNGHFISTFVVPKDIAYADSTISGRMVAYYVSSNTPSDGAGYTAKITVSGTDSAAADTTGPTMKIGLGATYESGLAFRSGDLVNEKPVLFVDLADSSGINTSTSGVGHRIEGWLNSSGQSIDLTDFYTSKLDNFRQGTVRYPLRDLPQGRNSIRVRAWDTYNNASMSEVFFEVRSSEQLHVLDVMNYPNPFVHGTAFTFRHNQVIPVNATVKIYTLAGRLIQTLDTFGAGDAFVKIAWDGRDRDGDVLANGVYLYKLIVRTVDGRFTSEVLGKLAVAK